MPDLGWQCLRLKIINKFGVTLLKEPAFKLFVPTPFISAFPKIWKKRCFPNVFSLPRSEHLTLHSAFRWHPYFQAIFFSQSASWNECSENRGEQLDEQWTESFLAKGGTRSRPVCPRRSAPRPSARPPSPSLPGGTSSRFATIDCRVLDSLCAPVAGNDHEGYPDYPALCFVCTRTDPKKPHPDHTEGPETLAPAPDSWRGDPGRTPLGACDAFGGGRGGHTVSSQWPQFLPRSEDSYLVSGHVFSELKTAIFFNYTYLRCTNWWFDGHTFQNKHRNGAD